MFRKKNTDIGEKTSKKEDKRKSLASFDPRVWQDPTFIAFIKEYWDFNFSKKYSTISMTIIVHVKPDGSTVNERIVVYFDIRKGKCKTYLVMNKIPHFVFDSIEFAGSLADWTHAIDTGNPASLKDGRVLMMPKDPTFTTKGSLGKTFPSMVKRVWTRMCDGAKPGIPVESSVIFGDDDLYEAHRIVGFNLNAGSGIDMLKIIKEEMYKKYLEQLASIQQENFEEFWQTIERIPNLDDYRGKKPTDIPMQLAADPFLKRDMLAIKNMSSDDSKKIDMARDLLERRRG